jgi:hypothetical protein
MIGGNVIKRIAAITSALLAAGVLTLGSATVAAAAPRMPAGSEAHHAISADPSCDLWFQNSFGGGNDQYLYARTGSPHQLLANTAKTLDCMVPDGSLWRVQQSNKNLCFNVESSAGGSQVDEVTCNASSDSQKVNWIENYSYSGNPAWIEGELQFVDVKAKDCIYQDGRDSPVDVQPCSGPGNSGDEWLTNW